MSLGIKDIAKNVSSKAQVSGHYSLLLTKSFINIIRRNKHKNIKISKFGVFHSHKSPKRIGRNPKTQEEFVIPPKIKLTFRASKATKDILN